jgi:hypothetical protein
MLSLFRRRKGRHQLGAAVTSIPSVPVAPRPLLPSDLPTAVAGPVASPHEEPEPTAALPMPPAAEAFLGTPNPLVPGAVPVVDAPPTAVVEVRVAEVPAPPATVVPEPAPTGVVPAGPRVELGFRDGSRTSLDPASEQARALDELASVLTRRD